MDSIRYKRVTSDIWSSFFVKGRTSSWRKNLEDLWLQLQDGILGTEYRSSWKPPLIFVVLTHHIVVEVCCPVYTDGTGLVISALPNVDALIFRHIPCQFVALRSSHWSVLCFYVEIIVFVIISLYWWLRACFLSDWKMISLQSLRVETWRDDNLISDYTIILGSTFIIRRTVWSSDLQLNSHMDTEWISRL